MYSTKTRKFTFLANTQRKILELVEKSKFSFMYLVLFFTFSFILIFILIYFVIFRACFIIINFDQSLPPIVETLPHWSPSLTNLLF